jgi:hypothetical protein
MVSLDEIIEILKGAADFAGMRMSQRTAGEWRRLAGEIKEDARRLAPR